MITLSKNRPARGTVCHRCQVIRLFVVCAIGLAVFAQVADDKLHYLQAVTPMRAAIAIWVVGITGFMIKLVLWRLERPSQTQLSQNHAAETPSPSSDGIKSPTDDRGQA